MKLIVDVSRMNICRSVIIAVVLCLVASSSILVGCTTYESTREDGTKIWDSGNFFIHHIGVDMYRITYTENKDSFNSKEVKTRLLGKAAKYALGNGYTHFIKVGGGQTNREDIIMVKLLFRCFGKDGSVVPVEAWDASKFLVSK